MLKLNFIIFVMLIFVSCSNIKETTNNKEQKGQSSEQNENTYRFIVSFISKGSGTDKDARKIFSDFLSNFEAKNGIKILFDKYPWGKEGEVDFCFKLSELTKDQQSKFIADLKSSLSKSDRVNYLENSDCKNKR